MGIKSSLDAFNISGIAPGSKFAKGSFTAANGATTTINNLTFTPSYVIVKVNVNTSARSFLLIDNTGTFVIASNVLYTTNSDMTLQYATRVSNGSDILANGFKHFAFEAGTFNFIAVKE